MESLVVENNLSSSLQTTLAVGGAVALVAGAVLHRHKEKLSSFLVENVANDQVHENVDWQKLTISAQVYFIYSCVLFTIHGICVAFVVSNNRLKAVLMHVLPQH